MGPLDATRLLILLGFFAAFGEFNPAPRIHKKSAKARQCALGGGPPVVDDPFIKANIGAAR